MGARFVVFGDAARLGSRTVVTLSLSDSSQVKTVGRVSIQVKGLEELPDRIGPATRELVAGAPDLVAAGEPQGALVGTGAVVAASGLFFDLTSSANGVVDGFDFVGPGLVGAGVVAAAAGIAVSVLAAPAEGGADG